MPSWGPADASLAILGLAPAAHGGNRTGRVFTGDRSGDWLFAALHRAGLAAIPTSISADDDQRLFGTRILAAVHCAPPDNKPTPAERDACRGWLVRDFQLLAPTLRGVLVLGAFAWNALWPALAAAGYPVPVRRPVFGHGALVAAGELTVFGCYHPSQQNTFTGKLTTAMIDDVVGTGWQLSVGGTAMSFPTRILVVGGGYVGLYVAMNLQKRLRPDEAKVTVVDPKSYMTYQPFLPEAGSGNLEPRHVIAPLRRVLNKCEIINGRIVQIDHASRIAWLAPIEGPARELGIRHPRASCPGSISRTLPIPGLAEHGIGFKSVAEAIYLRNHVLERMDAASSSTDPQLRRRALTFVFVGGGYAGIEALAELEDMARDACTFYPNLRHDEMRWVLVEATDRILPEVSPGDG